MIAFVLITRYRTIPEPWDTFLTDLKNHSTLDIYVMHDEEPSNITTSAYTILEYSDEIPKAKGYMKSCPTIKKDVTSWDKAIFHFIEHTNHDYVWFIEEDVFIPSLESLISLETRFTLSNPDLVCQKHITWPSAFDWWGWGKITTEEFDKPWCHSMSCAIRVSRKLLTAMQSHIARLNYIPFIEYSWNTIAAHENMKIENPPELSNIVWLAEDHDLSTAIPNFWYHPVKDYATHARYRVSSPRSLLKSESFV